MCMTLSIWLITTFKIVVAKKKIMVYILFRKIERGDNLWVNKKMEGTEAIGLV